MTPTEAPSAGRKHRRHPVNPGPHRGPAMTDQQERTPSPYVCADCPGGPDQTARAERAEARIEHLEAALREALSHIPQANTLKPHYERENVVREILERALTTSTPEDAEPTH